MGGGTRNMAFAAQAHWRTAHIKGSELSLKIWRNYPPCEKLHLKDSEDTRTVKVIYGMMDGNTSSM